MQTLKTAWTWLRKDLEYFWLGQRRWSHQHPYLTWFMVVGVPILAALRAFLQALSER